MSPPWFSTAIASGAASSSPWKLPFHPSEMLRIRGLRLRLPSPGQECEQLSSVFPFARYDDVEEITSPRQCSPLLASPEIRFL